MNILFEFEKRYAGDPRQTEAICEAIALEFDLDAEEVKDCVYLNRYETEIEETEEEDESLD